MRTTVRHHLGKVVAGAAVATAGTAAMIAVTLPGTAGAGATGGSTDAGGRTAGRTAGQQDAEPEGAGRQAGGPQAGPAGGRAGAGQRGGTAVPPGVVEAAPAQAARGQGRDPLTDDEIARVERIALNRQLHETAEDVDGDRGPQTIGVDLAEPEADEVDDPGAPRRAEVTFYDYKDDTLVTRTVNLDTGQLESTGSRRGVQPPLSAAEQEEAARLLIADPLGAGLKADYRDATGKELTSPGQLEIASLVYRAAPGVRPADLGRCGVHRCVRLLPKVTNGPWIDARSLVVDLSARTVARIAD